MGAMYLSLCAGCGAKLDPGLFGQTGRSTYHLREIPGSARAAARLDPDRTRNRRFRFYEDQGKNR